MDLPGRERLTAWAQLIERASPDGDNRLLVDADVAAQHATDLLAVLGEPGSARPWLHDRELEDAAVAAVRERERLRPTKSRRATQKREPT